jgi:AhpD family alkylhydroperoxidase
MWMLSLALTLVAEHAVAEGPKATSAPSNPAADAARADIKSTFGFVPGFLNAVPGSALPGAWEEMKGLQMNPDTALPGKIKELIGLAVSAQVPCKYCTFAHTEFAKLNGANETEVGEAVVMAALTRHWSTVLQGSQADLPKFKAELSALVARMKAAPKAPASMAASTTVTDAKSALAEIQQMFGSVPEFFKRFPSEGLAGACLIATGGGNGKKQSGEREHGERCLHRVLPSSSGRFTGDRAEEPCRYCSGSRS